MLPSSLIRARRFSRRVERDLHAPVPQPTHRPSLWPLRDADVRVNTNHRRAVGLPVERPLLASLGWSVRGAPRPGLSVRKDPDGAVGGKLVGGLPVRLLLRLTPRPHHRLLPRHVPHEPVHHCDAGVPGRSRPGRPPARAQPHRLAVLEDLIDRLQLLCVQQVSVVADSDRLTLLTTG